jgi:hypothetical protein
MWFNLRDRRKMLSMGWMASWIDIWVMRGSVTASMNQENVILVDALIYPTALALSERSWLALDSAEPRDSAVSAARGPAARGGQDELTAWVLQTLRRQARDSLAAPEAAPRTAHSPGVPAPHPLLR